MAQSALRYRRQVLAYRHHSATGSCTALLIDDSIDGQDASVYSIVHGMIMLQTVPLRFGISRRLLSVVKMRGSSFREGTHDYVIRRDGLTAFPRLAAPEASSNPPSERFRSGNEQLDRLMGGGLDAGTGTLLMGPAGSGKSTIASMYAARAAADGHRVVYYVFDETIGL